MDIFSFLKAGNKSSDMSSMGMLQSMFGEINRNKENPSASSSAGVSSAFGGLGETFGMFSQIMEQFLSPFAGMFQKLTAGLSSVGTKSALREYGVKVEFNEDCLSHVPKEYKDLFLRSRRFLSQAEKNKIDSEAEILLSDDSITDFAKRTRFRNLLITKVVSAVSSPDMAEEIETTCMTDFGTNAEEDVESLAASLIDLSDFRSGLKADMSPLERVETGNYDKAISRVERSITQLDGRIHSAHAMIEARIRKDNPEAEFTAAHFKDYFRDLDLHAPEGDGKMPQLDVAHCAHQPANIGHINGLCATNRFQPLAGLIGPKEELIVKLRDYTEGQTRMEEYSSEDQQRRFGELHAGIRLVKINQARFKLERDIVSLRDNQAVIDAEIGRYGHGALDPAQQSHKEALEAKQANVNEQIDRKERHLKHLNTHADEVGRAHTEYDYQVAKDHLKDIAGDDAATIRHMMKENAKRNEARAIVEQARSLVGDDNPDSATRPAARDLMERLSDLQVILGESKTIKDKRTQLEEGIIAAESALADVDKPLTAIKREEVSKYLELARKEIIVEDARIAKFATDNSSECVFATMRRKDQSIREDLHQRGASAKEKMDAYQKRYSELDEEEVKNQTMLVDKRFDGIKHDAEVMNVRRTAIYSNDGGIQSGRLIDSRNQYESFKRAYEENVRADLSGSGLPPKVIQEMRQGAYQNMCQAHAEYQTQVEEYKSLEATSRIYRDYTKTQTENRDCKVKLDDELLKLKAQLHIANDTVATPADRATALSRFNILTRKVSKPFDKFEDALVKKQKLAEELLAEMEQTHGFDPLAMPGELPKYVAPRFA